MLQNDNSDEIWKPLKIPLCFSGSIQKRIETKHSLIETQKQKSGFLLYTIDHPISIFTKHLLQKFTSVAGNKIIQLLLAVIPSPLNKRLFAVALIPLNKIKSEWK